MLLSYFNSLHYGASQVGRLGSDNTAILRDPLDAVTFTYSDAKLRGFGAAALFQQGPDALLYDTEPRYRLACGKGIKNVHIWQFHAPRSSFAISPSFQAGGGDGSALRPFVCPSNSWVCMYDVATNGNTITALVFRKGATELLTKSAGNLLRLWDLSSFDASSQSTRPDYEDIANSQDVKVSLTFTFQYLPHVTALFPSFLPLLSSSLLPLFLCTLPFTLAVSSAWVCIRRNV